MLTLTHNYYDRHATINCNFKSLKILQIQQKNTEKKINEQKRSSRNDCILCMNKNKMKCILYESLQQVTRQTI